MQGVGLLAAAGLAWFAYKVSRMQAAVGSAVSCLWTLLLGSLFVAAIAYSVAGTELDDVDSGLVNTAEFSALPKAEQNEMRLSAGIAVGLLIFVSGCIGVAHGRGDASQRQLDELIRERPGQ
jgi:hypothetical protein